MEDISDIILSRTINFDDFVTLYVHDCDASGINCHLKVNSAPFILMLDTLFENMTGNIIKF